MRQIIRGRAGIIMLAVGVLLILLPMEFLSDYDSMMGPWWNLSHTQLVLSERMSEGFMSIGGFREAFPMYADMGATEIAASLHARYFNDIPRDLYEGVFIPHGEAGISTGQGDPSRDPLSIRGALYDYRDDDPRLLALAKSDAIDKGLYGIRREQSAIPYWLFVFAGLLLVGMGIGMMLGRAR